MKTHKKSPLSSRFRLRMRDASPVICRFTPGIGLKKKGGDPPPPPWRASPHRHRSRMRLAASSICRAASSGVMVFPNSACVVSLCSSAISGGKVWS